MDDSQPGTVKPTIGIIPVCDHEAGLFPRPKPIPPVKQRTSVGDVKYVEI